MELSLNLSEILRPQNHSIEYVPIVIETSPEPINAHVNKNMNISFHVNGNLSDYTEIYAYMDGVDDSFSPPEIFEIISYSDSINATVKPVSNTSAIIQIDVLNMYIRQGGLFWYTFQNTI